MPLVMAHAAGYTRLRGLVAMVVGAKDKRLVENAYMLNLTDEEARDNIPNASSETTRKNWSGPCLYDRQPACGTHFTNLDPPTLRNL